MSNMQSLTYSKDRASSLVDLATEQEENGVFVRTKDKETIAILQLILQELMEMRIEMKSNMK